MNHELSHFSGGSASTHDSHVDVLDSPSADYGSSCCSDECQEERVSEWSASAIRLVDKEVGAKDLTHNEECITSVTMESLQIDAPVFGAINPFSVSVSFHLFIIISLRFRLKLLNCST